VQASGDLFAGGVVNAHPVVKAELLHHRSPEVDKRPVGLEYVNQEFGVSFGESNTRCQSFRAEAKHRA